MSTTVGAFEAKTHLASLLDKVEGGETVTITRKGRVIAKLVPASAANAERGADVVDRLWAFREKLAAEGVRVTLDEVRAWTAEGRR